MSSILGLMSTEQFANERFKSFRRTVFYQYPGGAAPLIGLLSMLDGEVLNDPEFYWYEDRFAEKVHKLVTNGTTSGPWFTDTSGAFGASMAATAFTVTSGNAYWLKVDSYEFFRPNDIINIQPVVGTAPTTGVVQLRITPNTSGVWTASGAYVRVVAIQTVASVSNTATEYTGVSLEAKVLGNSNMQGQVGSVEGAVTVPTRQGNCAQIFRTPFSFTGTALATSAIYDQSGPYKDKAKKAALNHMCDMENQFLFGNSSKSVDATSGLPRYTTGGILFFLRLWEVGNGNTYSGVVSNYGNTVATSNADDNKRIINLGSTTVTDSLYSDYLERLFRKSNEATNEKLALVGSGFLNTINKLYKSNVQFQTGVPYTDTYGMNVVKHVTPFGTVYYRTHPLLSNNANTRYNALFVDVQSLRYRYVQNRDTEIRKNTQPNDADYRKDEYLTEAGLELNFPESFMYLQNLTTV